jgi:uncharacterized membrane protein YhaH (DUF805 family)
MTDPTHHRTLVADLTREYSGERPTSNNRMATTAITIGLFSYLWLVGVRFGVAPLLLVLLAYLYLTVDRWRDIEIPNLSGLTFMCSLLALAADPPWHVSPLVQFGAIAPAVFVCISPTGIGRAFFDPRDGRIGRAGFMLWTAPGLVLMAARYWPALDHALAVSWSLVATPIETVPSVAAPLVLVFVLGFVVSGRVHDAGVRAWARLPVFCLVLARAFVAIFPFGPGIVLAFDVVLAACVLALCFWPSRLAEA